MKQKIKLQYFAVFIFLALMLFVKPDTVFAKVGGGSLSSYDNTSLINAKEFDAGNWAGQGRIADSFDDVPENMRQFSLGYKADFMQAGGTDAGAAWGNYSAGGNQTYSITGKALLIAFPKIITFVESAALDRRTVSYATGYLYMMVDSDSLKEQMQINSGLAAQELMPLFFTNKQTGKGEGEMLFSLPAFNMYLPLSNIKKGGAYYSQNSTKTNAKNKMVEICSAGKQDVENWSNWNDGSGFIVGEDNILPSSLKWSTIFAIGEMQENFRNTTGQAFNEERSLGAIYPTSATQLKSDINDIRSKYPAFADYVGPVTMINSGQIQYGYYGFKENATAVGGKITNFWDINGLVSREWTQDINTARIVKGEKLLQAAYNALTAGGSLNILDPNRNRISAQQMAGIYDSIAASAEDAGSNVNFIQYGSKSLVPRYQWACELGAVPNNTIDGCFSKDTQPKTTHERDRNLYKLLDYKINTSSAVLRSHSLTSMFSDYASSTYDSLPEQDKIESTLIYLTFDPIFVPLIASHNSNVRKYIGTGVDSIKKLNELGKTDYKSWKKCVLQIGNHLFSHSLVSTPPYIGWSSQAAFLGTTGGKTFYQIESVGISVVMSPLSPVYEDLLVSNSYNSQSVDTSLGENGATGSTFNYPTSRSYIDWATENLSGLNMTGLKKGGTSNPENPNTTKMKNLSGKQFDIYCGIRSISGAGQLAPDTDNIAAVGRSAGGKGTSNNSQIRTYSQNPAQHKFTTVFFVGRIPEADSEVEVKVGDMVPTVFASFNKFDLVWDAGFDDNASGRATVSINMSENKGTAQSALSSAIYAFSGDYNGSYLVSNYWAKGLNKSYNEVHNWEFGVTAKPLGILECDQKSLLNYAIPEYMTKGPEATGYSSIKMAGSFKGASESTKVNPGDVVAYTFDYAFPKNQSVLKSNIGRLISDGTWYTEYETLLMADLNIELLPSKKLKESEWADINSNTGNDWVKERLVAPVLHNVFFTEIKVDAVGGESFSKTGRPSSDGADYISQTKLTETDFGLPWLVAPAGGRDEFGNSFTSNTVYKHYYDLKPNKSTTNYSLSKVTVKFSWEYVTTLPIVSSNVDIANRIEYSNGLNRTFGIITGNQTKRDWTGQATDYMGYEYRGNVITVDPNQDILNFGKGNTVTLKVPNSSVNEFHGDWEEIIIAFNPPPKDNSVDDLVLLYNNSQLVGEASINRLNGGGAQAIDYKEGGSYTLYAIVRRNQPKFSWEEKVDGRKWSGDTVGCFEYATNENTSSHSKMVSHAETSIPGAARTIPMVIRNITSFKNPGDTLVFKVNLPSNLMYLEATFHYRDAYVGEDSEDIDLENNVWSESWSAKYPDFAVEVNQDFKSVFEKGGCGSQRTVVPNYTIIATQANPFYEGGGGPVTIDTSLGGWTVASGTTSGNKIIWYWGGGMEQNSYHITYRERRFPYQSPTFNEEFVFRAHINPEVRYNEKNLNNNYAKANFSVTLDCQGGPTSPIEPCTPEDWERLNCKYKYGVGKRYRWNVKFAWSQQNPEKTTSTNVYVAHYMEDVYGSDGNGGSVYLGQREVCPCYCDPSPVTGPNNGVRFWRTEIDGAPLYYEVHDLRIYLKSTNKATQWGWEDASVYDITGGTGYVSGGMMWNVFFDAKYDSDRGSMPRAMYSPFSQPYATGNGGSGCPTCNWLNRWPNPENVAGPRHVRIYYRGLQVIAPKTYEYDSPQQVLANGLVNKHFRWQPISGMMAMTKENTRQTLNIAIKSFAFTGHIYDTWNSVDGTGYSPPGYAWQNATFHCFCDIVQATVEFIPPRPYIASAVAVDENAQGADGNAPGKGEKVGKRDTEVEGTDYMETDDDQWMY